MAAHDLLDNHELYVSSFWKVLPKSGRPKPFTLNAPQRIVEHIERTCLLEGRPFMAKVLKSRQQGISTDATARAQRRAMTHEGYVSLSIADKQDLPAQWIRRAAQWYNQTPAAIRPHKKASNAIELYFDLIGSRYFIGSQAGQTPGMGYTIKCLHASELADWANPTKVFSDLLPSIPKNDADVMILFEGTGGVEGDWWSESWWHSAKGNDEFVGLFLPSFLTEEYRRPTNLTPANYTPEEAEVVRLAAEWARSNQEYARIAGFAGIEPEQIEFRRWTIANEFAGDVDLYRSKYPVTPEEAFLPAGRLAIPAEIIRHHSSMCREGERLTLEWQGDDVVALPYQGQGLCWEVWGRPDEFTDYAVGADVAEGLPADPQDDRSERDYSAIAVMNRRYQRIDALFHGRPDADVLGREMLKVAAWYNKAWMAPEVNNNGWATLAVVKGYKNLYRRRGGQEELVDRNLSEYGWKTGGGDTGTRNQMIDDWIADCRPDSGFGFQDKIEVMSRQVVREESQFITNKNGKREHARGAHDDALFACMIANQVHRLCPRGDALPVAPRRIRRKGGKPWWATPGGIDPGIKGIRKSGARG